MKKLEFYSSSENKLINQEIINAGTSDDNIKIIKLNKKLLNPKFYPRKFENWPDTFEVLYYENENSISVRRTDVTKGGWGEVLLIDVEYDIIQNNNLVSYKSKIPKVIYQTFENYNVPDGMYDAVNSWIRTNPDYEHYFYDEEKRIKFIKKYFEKNVLQAYQKLIPGAFKADLWRCCVLYIKGGVYVDSDMICIKNLNELIDVDDEFIIARDDPMSKKFLANGFIASIPNHPFLKKQIDNIVENVINEKKIYYLEISGPALFGKSVNNVCNRNLDDEFDIGKYNLNGYNVKILLHDFVSKSFKYNDEQILITEYPNKNNEMNKINNETFYSLYQKNMVYKLIPNKIYFSTYDKLGIHTYMYNSFQNKNPYWEIQHFDDEKCEIFFIEQNEILSKDLGFGVYDFYKNLTNGGEKSDFWRYCIIYLYGGLYSDADTFCNLELDKWIIQHDLILGIEANLDINDATSFGMDKIGYIIKNKVITVCNWTFAAKPKHNFFKKLIIDIANNPISNNVLLNTGPGRLTKHAIEYFNITDDFLYNGNDLMFENSILLNINRFGANQSHSNSIKNYDNELDIKNNDVYIIHKFDGTWRRTKNKKIKKFKSKYGVSHNLCLLKINSEFIGISRLDEDTSRTNFMKEIGDCRNIVEYKFDKNLEIISELKKEIHGYDRIAKFEDFRGFIYNNKIYFSASYIDENFNTKMCLLDNTYTYLGDIIIDEYNVVNWVGENKVWEKNWLFVEKNNELFFIYSTTPDYIVYKCSNFNELKFEKHLNIKWPLLKNVPENEHYFTSHIGSTIKIATGGSTHPIYIENQEIYLYFIHTKIYNERKYNHYAVILDKDLKPIKFFEEPILNKFIDETLLFLSSVTINDDYLIFSGGVDDNQNFVWELSKEQIFHYLKI